MIAAITLLLLASPPDFPLPQAPRGAFGILGSAEAFDAEKRFLDCLYASARKVAAAEMEPGPIYSQFSQQCGPEEMAFVSAYLDANRSDRDGRIRAYAYVVQRIAELRWERAVTIVDPRPYDAVEPLPVFPEPEGTDAQN